MMKTRCLSIKGLSYSYGLQEVLSDVSLQLDETQVISLLGPSGCGKTTLLKLCADLLDNTVGQITNPFESSVYMFQQANLLPWKNTRDNIALGLKAQGVEFRERCRLAESMGTRLGLVAGDFEKFPHELSGGMQQRVALARAFVLQPELLLLDEPFSALDIGLKLEFYAMLQRQVEENNTTVLIITHDLMEAIRLSNIIYLMDANPGRIVQQYPIDRPLHQRDDAWLYETTANLMREPDVVSSFSLNSKLY